MPAKFYEQDVNAKLKDRRALSTYLDTLIRSRKNVRKVHLTYVFCSDEYLHGINLQFLRHDDYTDIITFDFSEEAQEVVGEIYISIERIAENAAKFKTAYDEELHRVIFHGALHLCGLGDKKPEEQQQMRRAEDAALEAWYSRH
jgi:rRNA maturation RNase YbeY